MREDNDDEDDVFTRLSLSLSKHIATTTDDLIDSFVRWKNNPIGGGLT